MIERICEFGGRCIGTIETKPNGDKVVKNFNGVILGYYKKSSGYTTDFNGRFLYQGDMSSALLILKQ